MQELSLAIPDRVAKSALFALLILCPALSSAQAPAVDAVLDGEDNVAELRERISLYQAEVQRLDGNYDESSSELFLSLAVAQRQLGDYSQAIDAYREALQALRISEGLASESQLQVLDEFNSVLFEQREWEQLDTNYYLAFDIASKLFGASDPRVIDRATTLASWKIRAFQTGAYEGRADRSVVEAAEIYRKLIANKQGSDQQTNAQIAGYLSAKGLAHFYSARYFADVPVNEFQHAAAQNLSLQYCVPLILSVDGAQASSSACQANQIADPEYFAAQQREKNNTVRRHLGNMRQSFEEAITALESDPGTSTRDRALAILNLGDANLLAEDWRRANSEYARAYEMLSQNDEDIALRNELLDRPMKALQGILDSLPFDHQLRDQGAEGIVSFDVTERGTIENINIGGSSSALEQENIGAIAITLEQSVYRPRIVEGRPVVSRIEIAAADL